MRIGESSVFRIGLVALALSHWKQSSLIISDGLLPRGVGAVLFVAALYLTSFALLLTATARVDPRRFERWAYASLGLMVAAFAYRDAMFKAASETMPTTDAHVYMDVAARMLLEGENPYAKSLAEAFRVYRMPQAFSTPLTNGDFSDRLAYPSLSVLVLVPFVLLRIPTYLAYALCFVAALAWLAHRAPWWARPLVVALFTADHLFLSFAFGGVTDTFWMLCLVAAVFMWKRPAIAAILVGLACAQKQHPWFLVPYLVIRLGAEHREMPWRGVPARFALVVGGVFTVANLPFVLWGPKVWLRGALEPLVAPMIQLSEGLSAFSMTGYAVMPKVGLAVVLWSIYLFTLVIYARHLRVLRDLCWVLPGVVLWFGYRALMSYWYFYALTGVAALIARSEADDELAAPERSWRPTALAGATLALAIAGFVVWSAARQAPFRVTVLGPMDVWETRVVRMRIRVENRLSTTARPRFTVQSGPLQPLAWPIDFGPPFLAPGHSGEFVVRAPRGFHEFDVSDGARVAVSDGGDPGVRAFVTIHPDRSFRRIDAVPNGRFAYVETRNYLPLGWSLDKSDDAVSVRVSPDLSGSERVDLVFSTRAEPAAPPPALAACVAGQRLGAVGMKARYAALATTLALPESPLTFEVNVPARANVPPWDTIYGVRVAVMGWSGFVLFGDEARDGKLPSGEPFAMLRARRGDWSTVEVALRSILERLGAPLHERRFVYFRARDTDVPSVPLELGLFASVPGENATIAFGAVRQSAARPFDALFRGRDESRSGLAVWHAAFDVENGNYDEATALLEKAVETEPNGERWRLLGDARLLGGRPEGARAAYARSLELEDTPEANKGMGWALVALEDPAGAIPLFERARMEFEAGEKTRPRFGLLDSVRGLGVASAKKHDCDRARRFAMAVATEDPASPPLVLEGCGMSNSASR